jgi:hypothetical protein
MNQTLNFGSWEILRLARQVNQASIIYLNNVIIPKDELPAIFAAGALGGIDFDDS